MSSSDSRRVRGALGWLPIAVASLILLASCSHQAPQTSVVARTAGPSPLIDPAKIISGGPPPDGILPIDHPKFLSPSNVNFLSPREPVIAIHLNGDDRAYPVQILIWHEIVNDRVDGVPVTVTYCPLCNSGIAFKRPTINGRLLDFGTSGKVYESNLVMYDRQTRSLWPQVLGEAVVGPLTGTRLQMIPVQMVAWRDWLAANPRGKVLSRDTGAPRQYGQNPYPLYDQPGSSPFLFTGKIDPRLDSTARVVGIQVGSDIEAFPYDSLRAKRVGSWAVAQADVGGRHVVVFWEDGTASALDSPLIRNSRDVGSTGAFDRELNGRLMSFRATAIGILDDQTGSRWDIFGRAIAGRAAGQSLNGIISIESFWFDWAAFYPNTRIFGR